MKTKDKPTSWDNEEFYDLMQQYRHTPLADQVVVTKKFNNVKKYISTLLKEQREEAYKEGRRSLTSKVRVYQRKNIDDGLCRWGCGKPLSSKSSQFCEEHRLYDNAKRRERYNLKEEKKG